MDFPNKEDVVKSVQRHLNLLDDGKDGPKTWGAICEAIGVDINKEPDTPPAPSGDCILSPSSVELIIKYEVGGGESYYNKYLQKPTWPQGASGVTIGIGYDLGYNSLEQFTKDWKGIISDEDFWSLSKTLGAKGSTASKLVSAVSHIRIPWNVALEVFKKSTIPRFVAMTLQAFPQADKLHPDAFGVLVSIVFNRGGSLVGSTRTEMANIRRLIPNKDYKGIAREIRSMKRLWVGRGLDGLLRRRDEEALIMERCG